MILEKTLPLLLILVVAFGLKKTKILHREDSHVISNLVKWVIVPATVMNSLAGMVIQPGLLLLPVAAITVVAVLLCIGFLLTPLLGFHGKRRAAFLIGFPTLSLGTLGFPFMFAAFGSPGLALLVLFDLGHAFCLFVGIPLLATILGKGTDQFQLKASLLLFTKSPILWSYAIGIAINLLHVHISLLLNLFAMLSQGFVFLAMVIVALEVEISWTSLSISLLAMYLKIAIGVIVGVIVSLLFHFTGLEQIAVVLGASLPASLFTIVYAKEQDLDVPFLASLLSLGFPAAIIFSFLLISIMH